MVGAVQITVYAKIKPLSDKSSQCPHLNILLPRHEDEDVSNQPTEVDLQGLLYCCLHVVLLRSLQSMKDKQSAKKSKQNHETTKTLTQCVGLKALSKGDEEAVHYQINPAVSLSTSLKCCQWKLL